MPREKNQVFQVSRLQSMQRIISFLRAKKDLARRVEAYLMHIALNLRETKKVQGIAIIKDFFKGFENNLWTTSFLIN